QNGIGVHYRVRTRIFTGESSGGLAVPRSALFRGARNDWQVYVIRNGKAELQSVKVGLSNDLEAEITGGLAEGEQVVLAPEASLAEGTKVSVISTGDRTED